MLLKTNPPLLTTEAEQYKGAIEYAQQHPLAFVNHALKEELWEAQKDIFRSVWKNRRTTVRSCHAIGKSYTAGRIVLAYLWSHPHSIVLTTAPTFRQVEDVLWKEIRVAHAKAPGIWSGVPNNTDFKLDADWFALGLSTNEPSKFQGYHADNILVVVDESAGVEEQIFEGVEATLVNQNARLLLLGNPTNITGTFYSSHRSDSYHKIWISCFHTPNFIPFRVNDGSGEPNINASIDLLLKSSATQRDAAVIQPYLITPQWVYEKATEWGVDSPMFYARCLGQFPIQGEDTLIPLHLIEAATTRQLIPAQNDPEQIGADIARFGTDKTVFIYRKGPVALDIKEYSSQDTMTTAQYLHSFWGFHPEAGMLIDEVGIGSGVVDRVRQIEQKRLVEGINVGVAATDPERFFNLRAEMYWVLRERFVSADIAIPLDQELVAQLSNIKFKYTSRGQVQIESKEDMKKRGLPSPDKADALALAFGKQSKNPHIIDFMRSYANPT